MGETRPHRTGLAWQGVCTLDWVRFHRDSVRFIFNDAAGEAAARESSDAAAKILEHLKQNGRTSRAELSKKCFSGHLSASMKSRKVKTKRKPVNRSQPAGLHRLKAMFCRNKRGSLGLVLPHFRLRLLNRCVDPQEFLLGLHSFQTSLLPFAGKKRTC
ncbi:MAG: hypothetical protein IPK02_02260 [Candidatus Accumulibacter sp.]|uniref:Uncharacterized protein n=1 Tax=Candidatus Accumulibacter affinis TaxID=2954384 RepID=A0A935W231_9PROT|nr:hypothetical protein [Candidatus Accumulibacter affinis]